MITISLIGSGNLAHQLLLTLKELQEIKVIQITARTTDGLADIRGDIPINTDFSKILPADIHVLAISDQAIGRVSEKISYLDGLVAHTSGSVPMNTLTTKNKGVFYPLQTFSTDRTVDFSKIPICLEAGHNTDYSLLESLAQSISTQVFPMDSDQRKQLHLSAVMVNNFTNHIFYWAERFCIEKNLDFTLLHPLIEETVAKMKVIGPEAAQTGPARRGDVLTMQAQMESMPNAELKQLYKYISNSIQDTYGKKL